ncbi:MAG: hypothetical protein E3J21_23090, partial [Anaerolineales bacterium]
MLRISLSRLWKGEHNMRKVGLDSNRPVEKGAPTWRVYPSDFMAGTGTGYVRINFVLDQWSSPAESGWLQVYDTIVNGLEEKDIEVYGLIGHEAVLDPPGDNFRNARETKAADAWIGQYVENFVTIVEHFRDRVRIFESFNEPNNWHGGNKAWIHPYWFAKMLERIYRAVKELGSTDVILVSGPLLAHDIGGGENETDMATGYLRDTYQAGKEKHGWEDVRSSFGSYPLDGIGYHLYVREDAASTPTDIQRTHGKYLNAVSKVVRQQEGVDKKIYVSEFGWSSVSGEDFQAESLKAGFEYLRKDPRVALAIYFCTQDFPGGEYGLLRIDGEKKPAYDAFLEQARLDREVVGVTFEPTPPETPTRLIREKPVFFAMHDRVNVPDALDFDRYVQAFVEMTRARETQPPLTIGLYGSWGMGKSWLLTHIRDALRETPEGKEPQGRVARFLYWLRILLRGRPPKLVRVVEFNAWEYHTHELIWPGMVSGILKQLEAESSWPRRVWSRVRRNLQRQVGGARWKFLPLTIFAGILLGVLIAPLFNAPDLLLLVFGTVGLSGFIVAFQAILNLPFSKWLVGLFAGQEYGAAIGYMEEIKADIKALYQNLPEDSKIVVMIDDLDRCPPEKVVDVLEAIKLLLDDKMFIVFLGIDVAVVAGAVEMRYKDLLAKAGTSGYGYLDKIVQIPFRIPDPTPDEIKEFLNAQFELPKAEEEKPSSRRGGRFPRLPLRRAQEPVERGEAPPEDKDKPISPLPPPTKEPTDEKRLPPPTQPDAEVEERPVAFTELEKETFQEYAKYLRPNPRHIKRLLNVYRLVRILAQGESALIDNPRYLIKWLTMVGHWPFTTMRMLWRFDEWLEDEREASKRGKDFAFPELKDGNALRDLYTDVIGDPDGEDGTLLNRLAADEVRTRDRHDADPDLILELVNEQEVQINWEMLRLLRKYTATFNPTLDVDVRPATIVAGGALFRARSLA